MPIYKQTTEITNIDDLWSSVERDIEEVYFGDKQVFTVWAEYDGTLPATLNTNGDNMKQYQVWGNTGGVGDETVNLFNAYTAIDGSYINAINGLEVANANYGHSDKIYVQSNVVYYCSGTGGATSVVWFSENDRIISYNQTEGAVSPPINAFYGYINYINGNKKNVMFVKGSTAPETFVPFGYEVDMRVRSLNIYNSSETSWSADGTILNDAGEPISLEGLHYTTNFIPCEPGEVYYLAGSLANETRWRVYFYDSNKNWIRRAGSKSPDSTRLIAMDENASYFQLQVGIDISSTSDWNFIHSRTAPEKYQPYFNTVTPIYIGSDPLGEDEYMSYSEQKVYRRTVNLFDKDVALDGYEILNYGFNRNANWCVSDFIPVEGNTLYKSVNSGGAVLSYTDKSSQPTRLAGTINTNGVMTSSETKFIKMNCQISQKASCIVAKSDDLPETYIPYLQPTDPPVTLPALPTCEGMTIVDYAGSGTAPSSAYLKYKKGW